MNRRGFLSIAAKTPLVVGPSLVLAPALVEASLHPSEIDLRRYYHFLWSEHHRLGWSMGVGPFDSFTVDKEPSVRASVGKVLDQVSPWGRAVRVLTAAGL